MCACVLFSVCVGTLLDDEGVGHVAQLLHLSTLLLRQVLHGLLGVKAGPNRPVAVNLPLVLPRLQCALEGLGLRNTDVQSAPRHTTYRRTRAAALRLY